MGAHPGSRGSSAAWPRRSTPASRRCASRRRPRAPRRASIPARRPSSASTSTARPMKRPIEILRVDNDSVRRQQLDKLGEAPKGERDEAKVQASLLPRSPRARAAAATCSRFLIDAARATWPPSARFPMPWRKCSAATRRKSAPSRASTNGRRASAMEGSARKSRRWSTPSPKTTAGARACSLPRSARTAMTGARR